MTGQEVAEIIGQVAILVTAVTGLLVSLRNSQRIEKVRQATDGMKDALVAAAKDEGVLQEKREEQSRKDIGAAAVAAIPVLVPEGPLDVKITNLPSEPVPTITTGAEGKPGK